MALPTNWLLLQHKHKKEVSNVPLLYHSTLLENFKHFRTNFCWRLNNSDTSLSERLDFVLGSTLPP
jgi:hypothetical protein